MIQQKIFLIGLPGAGKTTLGRSLATLVSLPFYDLDKQIEKVEGLSVSEIFTSKGETYFRAKEAEVLRSLIDSADPVILSTGGGTPCFHENMDLMCTTGLTVFLDPSLEIIERRLASNRNRPLLQAEPEIPLLEKLTRLKQERLSYYTRASLRITDDQITAERLIQLLP